MKKILWALPFLIAACIVDTLPTNNPKGSTYDFPSEAPIWKTTRTIGEDAGDAGTGAAGTTPKSNRDKNLQKYLDADTQYGKDVR
jgi:hypothetical protein